ncbi:hypothetical protein B0T26DRAFT_243845 [Lasiosphaeria miniovina]|uniref:Uncharacterized protein n=1 Tax=Lasiosphaeria miniovina TaxID=1954250 RepID=A0AA40E042_9PEZI|nr:uncharacterized protein B0T26DRAFT_243845 [Lasiosphaeria miniovina]KAK0722974.1 hypothetical protein B0T26DRAFT_243845 [Lasiosphaeria miniovina]
MSPGQTGQVPTCTPFPNPNQRFRNPIFTVSSNKENKIKPVLPRPHASEGQHQAICIQTRPKNTPICMYVCMCVCIRPLAVCLFVCPPWIPSHPDSSCYED